MKKLLFSAMLLSVCSICFAQVKLQSITPAPNTTVPKLPDLRITSATVTAVSTSPGAYKLTIVCTVKNEGTAPISLADISYQGLVAPENKLHLPLNATAYEPACGTTAGMPRDMLQPGESITRDYFCFNRLLSPAAKPVYIILLNRNSNVKELNMDNNKQNVYITFN